MASFHPGVKSLIDRILKQQPSNSNNNSNKKKGLPVSSDDQNDKIESKLSNLHANTCKLTVFKDILKQKMKEKRQRNRQEELEEDQLDEEYHCSSTTKKSDEKNDDSNDKCETKKSTKTRYNDDEDDDEDEDYVQDEDDQDEDGDAGEEDDEKENNNDSDDDFKLNLDDDDANECEKKSKKKNKSKNSDDDENDVDGDEADSIMLNYHKQHSKDDLIPASIPPNQLTTSKMKSMSDNDDCDHEDDEGNDDDDENTKFRLYIEPTDNENKGGNNCSNNNNHNGSSNNIENISFNFDQNSSANNQSINKSILIDNDLFETECDEDLDNNKVSQQNGEEFDELAMLCSGQFAGKSCTAGEQKREVTQQKKVEDVCKEKESDGAVVECVVDDEGSKESKVDLYDEDGEDNEEEKEREEKNGDEDDEENVIVNPKSAFFDNEAELSGSEEADSDENYDGEEEDDQLVCSGDEDDLPSESELKDELGKIYLKDQLDADKRELRMIKEIYLKDGEFHSEKGFRKKNFRWKSLNDNRFATNPFSSEEEDDDDDEDEVEEENEQEDKKRKSTKLFENSKLIKSWRTNRHEREQFIDSKKVGDTLSSDEETRDSLVDDSSQSLLTSQNCKFMKIGQNLLKSKQKRTLDECLNENDANNGDDDDDVILTKTVNKPEHSGSSIVIQSKKSITITQSQEKTTTTTTTSSSQSYLEKYSFLKKDKTYLSRISNYVNKTLNIHDNGKHSSIKNEFKPNKNMVFACLSQKPSEPPEPVNEDEGGDNQIVTSKNPIKPQEPLPKRAKYDSNDAESIFNHL